MHDRRILISDSTLKHCEGYTFREKLETVRLLGKLGIDALEFGPIPAGDKSAALLCRTAGALLGDCVLSVEVTSPESADAAAAALSSAKRPRLAVSLPISTVQAEYLYHKKPAAMVGEAQALVAYAKTLCPDVIFRACDATRAEPGILSAAAAAAASAGAGMTVICDAAGEILPDEMAAVVDGLRNAVGDGVTLGVECSDRMGLASAAAIAAVRAGAGAVSCSVNPGAVPFVGFAEALSVRGRDIGLCTGADMTLLRHTAGRIAGFASGERGRTPFENGAGAAADGSVSLGADADISAVAAAAAGIGYELSDDDKVKVYASFRQLVDKSGRRTVGARELDAIVASVAPDVPPEYRLDTYVINSGNTISSTAHITLRNGAGEKISGFCVGDGPIDAAFLAIEQIIGHHYELDDFQIQAVTEGREAMGDALVRLRAEGRLYSGKGLSTDIIGASVEAYVNALNKIVYERGRN